MFDYYEPEPAFGCPVCETPLREWQGTGGSNVLFVWRQGSPSPVRQEVPREIQATAALREESRLPETFMIYSTDCACPYRVEAIGHTEHGVWMRTELVTVENAERFHDWYKHWRRAELNAWRRWLSSGSILVNADSTEAATFRDFGRYR